MLSEASSDQVCVETPGIRAEKEASGPGALGVELAASRAHSRRDEAPGGKRWVTGQARGTFRRKPQAARTEAATAGGRGPAGRPQGQSRSASALLRAPTPTRARKHLGLRSRCMTPGLRRGCGRRWDINSN